MPFVEHSEQQIEDLGRRLFKLRIAAVLREEIAKTVTGPEDVETELRTLMNAFRP